MKYLQEYESRFGKINAYLDAIRPLTIGQYNLWLEQQLYPCDIWNHGNFVAKVHDSLDQKAFQKALWKLAKRYEVFRTIYPVIRGIPVRQLITTKLKLDVIACSHLSDAEIHSLIHHHCERSFDLTKDFPFRFIIYKKTDSEYYLQIVQHHIIFTMFSYVNIPVELARLYVLERRKKPIFEEESQFSYSHFAITQYENFNSHRFKLAKEYWTCYLEGHLPVLLLPFGVKNLNFLDYSAKVLHVQLDDKLLERLKIISRTYGISFFSLLTGAFQILLHRYTGQEEIIIGISTDERSGPFKEVIGYTVNTLPLRSKIALDKPFSHFAKEVYRDLYSMMKHRFYPLSFILEDLHLEKENAFTKLFEVAVISQSSKEYPEIAAFGLGWPNFSIKIDDIQYESTGIGMMPCGRFDLALAIVEMENQCAFSFHYNSLIFSEKTIRAISQNYLKFLTEIISHPDKKVVELFKISDEETQLLISWNDTSVDFSHINNLIQDIEEKAKNTPDAIAVIFNEQLIDYNTLNQKANQLARELNELSAQPEVLIGIAVERSIDLIVALLAVIKSGSAYLPLDIQYPKERLQFILKDSDAKILITQSYYKNTFLNFEGNVLLLDQDWEHINKREPNNLDLQLSDQRLAYVIYTSGSTGKPKGVEVPYSALQNALAAIQNNLQICAEDRWLALTTISFDISNLEILLPLRQGATVVLADQDTMIDPFKIAGSIEINKVSIVQATPSTWQMLLDFGWLGTSGLTLLCGGETLSLSLANQLMRRGKKLWNMYGPTETTIWSSMKMMDQKSGKVTLGKPIANTTFYILDEFRNQVPLGVSGELHIGGLGLARSYRNRTQLTEEKFIHTPFSEKEKLYCTGDLTRFTENGEIEFLGRIDHQVKIHGYRIELDEIEGLIKQCAGVKQAIVVVREDTPGDQRIVAYYQGECVSETIETALNAYLPHYMRPSVILQLEAFPLNNNNKIDRKALPLPNYLKKSIRIAPQSPIESEIAKVFETILGIDGIGSEDNFFSLGGHSLLVVRVIMKLNQIFRIHLPFNILFKQPTVVLLAAEIQNRLGCKVFDRIPKIDKSLSMDISPSQQSFWFLSHQMPSSALYSIPYLLEIMGPLDCALLQQSLHKIVERHEILRTVFQENATAVKAVILDHMDTSFLYVEHNSKIESDHFIAKEAKKPFDLLQGPLFRFILLKLSDQKYRLFLNFHHIVFDAYSVNLFIYELKELYEGYKYGKLHSLDNLHIQYGDYASWRAAMPLKQESMKWWLKHLEDTPLFLNLLTDRPRPVVQTHQGTIVKFSILSKTEFHILKQFAQEQQSTLFVVLLAVFHLFLVRYTGQNDMVIGVPVLGRTHTDLSSLMGCFINTLPIRIQSVSNTSFVEFVLSLHAIWFKALEHQDIPFEQIVRELKLERSLNYFPLFQTMFNMLPEMNIGGIADLQVELCQVDRNLTHFDLSLSIQESTSILTGFFEYNTDLFSESTITQMIRHFQNLIKSILLNPHFAIENFEILDEFEISEMIVEWNRQPFSYSMKDTILSLIEDSVQKTPDALAIICGTERYTYLQLNRTANQIAHALLSLGLKKEDKVAIYLERCAAFIPAVLGILKAGGAYVPLDPLEPQKRTRSKLEELLPFCILTQKIFASHFSQLTLCIDTLSPASTENLCTDLTEGQLAYMIYTSGTTGKPKGVEIEYQGINDRVMWKQAAYPLNSNDAMLHTYSFIFDGSIINYFWPLCVGARLIIATQDALIDSEALIRLIREHYITTLDLLPSLLQNLVEEKEFSACDSLKNVFSGGEALPTDLIRSFFKKSSSRLHNTYGPTEATVEASVWECSPDFSGQIAPIGNSIAGSKLYILSEDGNLVPKGVAGELYIGGIGVARGYFNDPMTTQEKFIISPLNGERLYRTGDRARYLKNGIIEFLGRTDNYQVKIRGYRIDLREIESALMRIKSVKKAVVLTKGESAYKKVVAYVKINTEMSEMQFFELMRNSLIKWLPAYMIPQQICLVEQFPLLSNGKINFRNFPEPTFLEKNGITQLKPKNKLEQQILSIWQEVLDFSTIHVNGNFFEIGGNSLLAMRLMAMIRNKLGISIPLVQFLLNPTIKGLAKSIKKKKSQACWSPLVPMHAKGEKEPFFCVHPVGGSVMCYHSLVKHWDKTRPFYALQARGLEEGQEPHSSIEAMANEYIAAIRKVQEKGPYLIGGWSFGGLVAAEMARQLNQLGEHVSHLVLIDTTANIEKFRNIDVDDDNLLLSELTQHFCTVPPSNHPALTFKEQFAQFIESGGKSALPQTKNPQTLERLILLARANYRAIKKLSISSLDIKLFLLKTATNPEKDMGWNRYVKNVTILSAPGDHWAITRDKTAKDYAQILEQCFNSDFESNQIY